MVNYSITFLKKGNSTKNLNCLVSSDNDEVIQDNSKKIVTCLYKKNDWFLFAKTNFLNF